MESEENIQKCPKCSAIIPKNKKFCTQCGSEIINKPEETVPEETVPEETVPEKTAPEKTAPEETAPEKTAPEKTAPEKTAPEKTAPEKTVPEKTVPEKTVPEETVPEETICPNCSAILTVNQKFCSECGSEIINKPEETVPEETDIQCPNCSAVLTGNQKFCSECGSEIVNKPEETICPNCSAILTGNQKFCTECGSDINQENNTKIPKKIGKDSINDIVNSVMKGGEQFVKDVDVIIKKSRSNKKEPKNLQTEQKPQSQTQDPLENELDQLKYLEKLAELKDKGLISEEEFKKKKEDILKL